MLRLLVCLALAAFAASQGPCCSPDQWEGYMGHLAGWLANGQLDALASEDHIHYDYTNRRHSLHWRGELADGTEYNFRVITDYNKKMSYHIDYTKSECQRHAVTTEMRRDCVEEGETFLGQFYYGAGTDKLVCHAWEASAEDRHYVTSRTVDDCLLVTVGEITYRDAENAAINSFNLVDVTPGIRSPEAFTPPSFCTQEPANEEPGFSKNHKVYQLFKKWFSK